MPIKIIKPSTISFYATISEEDLRERISLEVLEQIGALDANGDPHPGVRAIVHRGAGGKGGYTIEVSGPMPAQIMLPAPRD